MIVSRNYGGDTNITGELVTGASVIQSFIALYSFLSSIDINFATFKKTWINSKITVEIIDSDNNKLFTKIYAGNCFRDNDFLSISCNLNLEINERYFIRIFSLDGYKGGSVTCRWSKCNTKEILFINGSPKKGEIYYRLNYEDRVEKVEKQYKQGLISIIIPSFNSSKFIENTLKSIKEQFYNNLEVIIIDDGSKDIRLTDNIARQYGYDIKIHHKNNLGAPVARNEGANIASGEFLFFCDSDIILDKNIFMKMIQSLHDNKDCSWVYCNYMIENTLKKFQSFDSEKLKKNNLCSTMSLIRHRDFISFDERLKRLQDWDLFLSMSKIGKKGIWLDEVLFTTIDRADGITKNSISWEEATATLKHKHGI